jgi:hypothetical protein
MSPDSPRALICQPSLTTEFVPSSPVNKPAEHFAEHLRDEVQRFVYDKGIHKMNDIETSQEFFSLLGVPDSLPPNISTTATQFTFLGFVDAANAMAKSLRDERECLLYIAFLPDAVYL